MSLQCLWFKLIRPDAVQDEERVLDEGFNVIEKADNMTAFETVKWITKQTKLSRRTACIH